MLSIEKLQDISKYRLSMENANKQQLSVESTEELSEAVVPINIQRKPAINDPKMIVEMLDKQTQTDSD